MLVVAVIAAELLRLVEPPAAGHQAELQPVVCATGDLAGRRGHLFGCTRPGDRWALWLVELAPVLVATVAGRAGGDRAAAGGHQVELLARLSCSRCWRTW